MKIMVYCICFIFAVLVLLTTAVLFIRKKGNKLITSGVGVFLAMFALFLPADSGRDITNAFTGIVSALFRSIRVFGLNEDFITSEFDFGELPLWFNTAYICLLDLLYLIAPILTFGLILSIFNNISSGIRLLFSFSRNIFVFSDKNTRAEVIAEDIRKQNPHSVIVFYNSENSFFGENERAISFSTEVLKINKFVLRFSKHITFYICSNDENANIGITAELLEIIGKNPKLVRKLEKITRTDRGIDLYYFYSKKRSFPILNGFDKCHVRVRRINEIQNVIYNLMYKEPVLKYVDKITDTVNIAVVGAGRYGEEFIRAAIWSGQHRKYKLNINVFDSRNVKETFTNQYPELVNTERLPDSKDINYKINFFDKKDFFEINIENIEEMQSLDLAFVALGNDDENIEASLYLRECSERMNAKPKIFTIITDMNLKNKDMVNNLKNHKGEEYNIDFILPNDIFSRDNAIALEDMGKYMHKKWAMHNNPKITEDEIDYSDFYDYEFFYWSSVASTMFWMIRKKLGENTDVGDDENVRLEHQRWSAYMRGEGYRYAEKRNDMAKQHNALADYKDLSDNIKANDRFPIQFFNEIDESDRNKNTSENK